MRWLRERWGRFWFEPAPPTDLGACRALFYGALLLLYLDRDFSAWGEVSLVFWMPTTFFRILHLPVLSPDALVVLQVIWKAALGLSCLGLFTRLSTATTFVLGFYLLGLPHCFGATSHGDAILVFVFGIMALSRCGDSLSMDEVRRAMRRGSDRWSRRAARSGEYTWPVRMVWVLMSLVFFAAGVAKLRASGLEWVLSDSMSLMLIRSNYGFQNPLSHWGLYVAQWAWLCHLLAAGTIAIEVGFPLSLVSRVARWMIVPGAFLMQFGIRFLMGPVFDAFMVCYLFWIPWDRVADRIAARQLQVAPAPTPAAPVQSNTMASRSVR
jgi:hypothetical protein